MPRHSLEKVPWTQLATIPLEHLQDLQWPRYMYLFMLPGQRPWGVDIDVLGCLVSLLTKSVSSRRFHGLHSRLGGSCTVAEEFVRDIIMCQEICHVHVVVRDLTIVIEFRVVTGGWQPFWIRGAVVADARERQIGS